MGKILKPVSIKYQIKRQAPGPHLPGREIPYHEPEGDICLWLWLSAKKNSLHFR